MTQNEKNEQMRLLDEQLLHQSSIMSASDAHANKCVKIGLVYKDTYPDEYAQYIIARDEYNKLEIQREALASAEVDDDNVSMITNE